MLLKRARRKQEILLHNTDVAMNGKNTPPPRACADLAASQVECVHVAERRHIDYAGPAQVQSVHRPEVADVGD